MPARTTPLRIVAALVLFGASLLLFDRAFFAAALQMRRAAADSRTELQRKLGGLREKAAYQVLVLGSSRTFEAVHPGPLRRELGVRAFKEASQGKAPRYNFEFYQAYRQLVGIPRLVIYGVDYFIFDSTSDPLKMGRFSRRDAPIDFGIERGPLLMVANKAENDRALLAYLRVLQRGLLTEAESSRFDPDVNVRDMEGYEGRDTSKVVRRQEPASYLRAPFHHFPGAEGAYFERLLQQLESDGVAVLLVSLPDYIGTYRTNVEQDEFVRSLRELAARHRGCLFVNYNDPSRFPLADASLFLDGDYGNTNSHLSLKGARALESLLLPDVRKLWDAASTSRPAPSPGTR